MFAAFLVVAQLCLVAPEATAACTVPTANSVAPAVRAIDGLSVAANGYYRQLWKTPPAFDGSERRPDVIAPRPSAHRAVAITLGLLIAGGTLVAIARRRGRAASAREVDMRLQIAIDLHDDIGSDLGALALMADIAERNPELTEHDRLQFNRISALARETSEKLREIVWLVNPEHDSVGDLVHRMRSFAAVILPGTSVRWELRGDMASVPLHLTLKRDVLLVFKEVLHNIARHASASAVTVRLFVKELTLHLEIVDDGVGFNPLTEVYGCGIRSIRERAKSHSGHFVLCSSSGTGTRVCFSARITQTSDGEGRVTRAFLPTSMTGTLPSNERGRGDPAGVRRQNTDPNARS